MRIRSTTRPRRADGVVEPCGGSPRAARNAERLAHTRALLDRRYEFPRVEALIEELQRAAEFTTPPAPGHAPHPARSSAPERVRKRHPHSS